MLVCEGAPAKRETSIAAAAVPIAGQSTTVPVGASGTTVM